MEVQLRGQEATLVSSISAIESLGRFCGPHLSLREDKGSLYWWHKGSHVGERLQVTMSDYSRDLGTGTKAELKL